MTEPKSVKAWAIVDKFVPRINADDLHETKSNAEDYCVSSERVIPVTITPGHDSAELHEWSLAERAISAKLSERLAAAIRRLETIAETNPEISLEADLAYYREVELVGMPRALGQEAEHD